MSHDTRLVHYNITRQITLASLQTAETHRTRFLYGASSRSNIFITALLKYNINKYVVTTSIFITYFITKTTCMKWSDVKTDLYLPSPLVLEFGIQQRSHGGAHENENSNKCISEGLMHVATWYCGISDPRSPNSRNNCGLDRPLTLPNFVTLWQKVCQMSPFKNF